MSLEQPRSGLVTEILGSLSGLVPAEVVDVAESEEGPEQRVVDKFVQDGSVDPASLPIATLSILWYVEPDGMDNYVAKFDGKMRTGPVVGDLTFLIHHYLHEDDDED